VPKVSDFVLSGHSAVLTFLWLCWALRRVATGAP